MTIDYGHTYTYSHTDIYIYIVYNMVRSHTFTQLILLIYWCTLFQELQRDAHTNYKHHKSDKRHNIHHTHYPNSQCTITHPGTKKHPQQHLREPMCKWVLWEQYILKKYICYRQCIWVRTVVIGQGDWVDEDDW